MSKGKNFVRGRLLCVLFSILIGPLAAVCWSSQPQRYAIVCWNNLGMHCYNRGYSDLAVLPPYNTLWAQVIKVGDPPQIVTDGIRVEYYFPGNTYSAGNPHKPDKTNFWDFAAQLFDVNLPVNVGLAGKGLRGQMDLSGDHFVAEGIPLTEYPDSAAKRNKDPETWKRSPFQMAVITVTSTNSNKKLATIKVVAPVSSELNCSNCHTDDGDATTRYPITPTGSVFQNILSIHDYLNPGKYDTNLMDSRPVLCAKCHADNAIGKPGLDGVSNLSNAMHRRHKDLMDITPDTNGCYKCHPGPQTKCLRDTMTQRFAFNCLTCHGDMNNVSQNPSPWLNEPKCSNSSCHGEGYALTTDLYRESKGHGQIYCAGCHDSPHAIATSRERNDTAKFITLQKYAGTLTKCTVCHSTQPTDAFVHRAR
jgi:hypothetical protein